MVCHSRAGGGCSATRMEGLVDVTLPQHLELHLGPLPVTVISAVSRLDAARRRLVNGGTYEHPPILPMI